MISYQEYCNRLNSCSDQFASVFNPSVSDDTAEAYLRCRIALDRDSGLAGKPYYDICIDDNHELVDRDGEGVDADEYDKAMRKLTIQLLVLEMIVIQASVESESDNRRFFDDDLYDSAQ